MSGPRTPSPVLLLAAGFVLAIAARGQEIDVSITADVREVDLGKPFALLVTRTWSGDLVPEDWRDEALAPLVVRSLGTTRDEEGGVVREVRRFECWAFERETVAVPPVVFRATARDDGPERVAVADGLELTVRSALGPGSAGPVELPGGLLPEPWSWRRLWPLVAASVAVLAGLGWAVSAWWRRRARLLRAPPPPPSARDRALARLHQRAAGEAAGGTGFHDEMAAILRDYLRERFDLGAPELTTEELVAAAARAPLPGDPHRRAIDEILTRCDAVKFGAQRPGMPERQAIAAAVERLVTETAASQSPIAGGVPA